MKEINLRDFYPWYKEHVIIEVAFEKEASMVQSITYQSETKTVPFQGKSIVLENLTPVLSPKEKEKRKKEIERCLYEVFSKYKRAGDTPA